MSELTTNSSGVYCVACGNSLVSTSAMCPKCGTPRAHLPNQLNSQTGKTKSTAVVLAVFLSFWSYLYSYKHDKSKFWSSLIVATVTGLVNFYWNIIGMLYPTVSSRPENLAIGAAISIVYVLTSLLIWILAIIVATKKNKTF